MNDQKNMILAIVLSALVLIGWQIFVGMPQLEKQKQIAQQQAQERSETAPAAPVTPSQPGAPAQPSGAAPQPPGVPSPGVPGAVPGATAQTLTREAALEASPRVHVTTPRLDGSVENTRRKVAETAESFYK